jgi:DNA-binding NarL/FixJ family response regulator
VRVILADDAVVIRQGLAHLLNAAGVEVVAEAGDGESLVELVARLRPDVAVVDIRMPPTYTTEGLHATALIRHRHPDIGVLVLSQYVDVEYALGLLRAGAAGVGYLLKDRIVDVDELVADLHRLARGETVVDPALVSDLLTGPATGGRLAQLTSREREVLALMAEGLTDRGIAARLTVSIRTAQAHVEAIFRKLDLPASPDANRRVHAVLTYLNA